MDGFKYFFEHLAFGSQNEQDYAQAERIGVRVALAKKDSRIKIVL